MVHYTLKQFLKSAVNYLIIIDIMMNKKYSSQKREQISNLDEKENIYFPVNVNDSPRLTRTDDMRFTSPLH